MSIIDNFNANGLGYTTSGIPNSGYSCDSAFDKNNLYYRSTESPFWQITFEKIVTIGSYTLKTKSFEGWYMTVWKISYSLDGNSFVDLQNDCVYDSSDNILMFPLRKLIRCKSFKITGVHASDKTDDLIFNNFDCFSKGSLSRIENKCSCNFYFYKRRLTVGFLLTLFPSFLTQC